MARLRHRLSQEEGFTLIELLIVIVIIGILLAIAIPSYIGFRGRAQQAAAQSNVKSAIPAAETYYSDNGTYAGMNLAALQAIDSGVATSLTIFGNASSYCISDAQGTKNAKVVGPGGTVSNTGPCTSATG